MMKELLKALFRIYNKKSLPVNTPLFFRTMRKGLSEITNRKWQYTNKN